MSIHLVGGGWAAGEPADFYRGFLFEAAARALLSGREVPRVGVLLVRESDGDSQASRYRDLLQAAGPCEPVITEVTEGELFASAALTGIDALLIGGGHTPSYADAVAPLVDEIRLLVGDELPYLGFSAGAVIAADAALIGGWRIGEVEVGPERVSEDLDELTVVEGLGLVDLTIEVHAAQEGTLTRLIAAVGAELVEGGLAIDEQTALVVGGDDEIRVLGTGNVWQVVLGEDGVIVSPLGS